MRRVKLITLVVLLGSIYVALCAVEAADAGSQSNQTTSAQHQDAPIDLQSRIRALGSSNPVERASAACTIGSMGKRGGTEHRRDRFSGSK